MKVKQVEVVTYKDVVIPEAEDVLNFLRDLNDDVADKVFVKNLATRRKGKTLEKYLEEVEEYHSDGSSVIASAFVWEETPEGWEYWNLVDYLWRKHLAELKVKVGVN